MPYVDLSSYYDKADRAIWNMNLLKFKNTYQFEKIYGQLTNVEPQHDGSR